MHLLNWSIVGFPLQALDLSDYCHITDTGISHVAVMHSLTTLLLSRTKLTDDGMPFIAGDNIVSMVECHFNCHVACVRIDESERAELG